jgi:hypothetical protein
MATRPLAVAALSGAVILGGYGCSAGDDESAGPQPVTVTLPEVGLEVDVPGQLADLTYSIGESEEGQPALYFSTEHLAAVGGPSCAAGATAAVSPYPLGQIVVSEETPKHVREEARENPEENLGRFVKHVGDHYLFYVAPPAEPCVSDDADAKALQRELTADLRDALPTLSETT